MRVIAVIQARTGSTRLPGKVLAPIGARPLVLWTLEAAKQVPGVDRIVVATTTEALDDPLVEILDAAGVPVHRGPVLDVLTRVWDAAAPASPDYVVRATADNPFMDPAVVAIQLRRCIDDDLDYVGTAGWPLGIAAEVARAGALGEACREARDPAEREHVMPFLYARPERYRIGSAPPRDRVPPGRFTVDTPEDLEFARAIAARLGPVGTCSVARLCEILDAEPGLVELNSGVRQKAWREMEQR